MFIRLISIFPMKMNNFDPKLGFLQVLEFSRIWLEKYMLEFEKSCKIHGFFLDKAFGFKMSKKNSTLALLTQQFKTLMIFF